jgi:hypothetical protein
MWVELIQRQARALRRRNMKKARPAVLAGRTQHKKVPGREYLIHAECHF